jgi:hypothetical protein
MRVRLTQIDGKLPNLALMKLSHWHKARGDEVTFTREAHRDLWEPDYDVVYGSAIFKFSFQKSALFLTDWPNAILGGTGTPTMRTVETLLAIEEYEHYDYDIYPNFAASLGFTERGCRLSCKFCVVPTKEGKPRSTNRIADIWRGGDHPRTLHLLDNDFFGQPEPEWRARIEELRDGAFKVCLSQGINVRHLTPEAAKAIASVNYRDDSFVSKRLYTAWDNLKDENVFFRGVEMLREAGVPPSHLMAYMLVGYDKNDTWERVLYRFNKMVTLGIRPFPMVYGDKQKRLPLGGYNGRVGHKPLWQFQKWAIRRYYELVPFEHFDNNAKGPVRDTGLFADLA